jgi:hypothetical protein
VSDTGYGYEVIIPLDVVSAPRGDPLQDLVSGGTVHAQSYLYIYVD